MSTTETLKNDNSGAIGNFDLVGYSNNLNKQINFINSKLKECEIKLNTLKNKEKIMNSMIDRTGVRIDQYLEANNYKMSSILQKQVLDYFETLNIVQDTLMKYEDLVFKYIKMLLDIENYKINAYTKIKAADKKVDMADDNYSDIMTAINEMIINNDTKDNQNNQNTNIDLVDSVKQELQLEGY